MGITLDSANSFPIKVNTSYPQGAGTISASKSSETSATSSNAYVYDVDSAALTKSLIDQPDAPLSDAELKQLFSVYTAIGRDDPLWKDIGRLLTEFSGNDRSNFLSVISGAGNNLKGFVSQLSNMDEENRSIYLRTAVRLDPKQGLKNLIESVGHLSGDTLGDFLGVADGLGRSLKSFKAEELSNFMAAAANSPDSINALTQKTAALKEGDRAFFLKAAAMVDGELDRLINMSDKMTGNTLTLFLKTASKAGKGLSNFLDLTQGMDRAARSQIMEFASNLSDTDAENYFIATQGLETYATSLLDTAQSMSQKDQTRFLRLGAVAGDDVEHLLSVVNGLDTETNERSDFLSTAIQAEDKLSDILDIAQGISKPQRADVFSFTKGLSFVDLSSFIAAAKEVPSQAHDLATSAKDLQGKNKSYLLYAASLSPDKSSELAATAEKLDGNELKDFLFLAANTDPGSPETMAQLIDKIASLSDDGRADFLSMQRKAVIETSENPLENEYVFLNSVFSKRQFDFLIKAGAEKIDYFTDNIDAMDPAKREAFFTIAARTKQTLMPKLISVVQRLDDKQVEELKNFSQSLNKESLSDLIEAADLSLGTNETGKSNFNRLMETARDLYPASRDHFLNAAAKSGESLTLLMDLTDQQGPWNRANFLNAADRLADIDDGQILAAYLKASDVLIKETETKALESNDSPEGIRPSQIIDSKSGIFNPKPYMVDLELYFDSAAFVASSTTMRYSDQMEWYQSFL